jgi:hypothetical protein
MAIWRKAKDHYAAASRMSSAVARKTLALGAVEAVDATRAVDCQPEVSTAVPPEPDATEARSMTSPMLKPLIVANGMAEPTLATSPLHTGVSVTPSLPANQSGEARVYSCSV